MTLIGMFFVGLSCGIGSMIGVAFYLAYLQQKKNQENRGDKEE